MRKQILYVGFMAMMCIPQWAKAATTYGVVYRSGNDNFKLLTDLQWNDFHNQWVNLENNNLRLTRLRTYLVGNTRMWAGIFRAGNDARASSVGLEWDAFHKQWTAFEKQNLRMVSFESYVEGGKRVYAGVFRAGTDAHAAIIGQEWGPFLKQWTDLEKQNVRVVDFRTYIDGGKRVYSAIFRAGSDARGAVIGKEWNEFQTLAQGLEKQNVFLSNLQIYEDGGKRLYAGIFRGNDNGHWLFIDDKEGVDGATHEWTTQGARPVDVTVYDNHCDQSCANNAVMQKNKIDTADSYDYGITMTKTHCPGLPNTCNPKPGDVVYYDWPVDVDGSTRYARVSALLGNDQIFTLPFTDPQVHHVGTWLYSPGSWHHAIDYLRDDHQSFKVQAAAPGRVVHIGWDNWSGNTVIVSHDAGGVKDAYRTIYMHLHGGPEHDCDAMWTKTVPTLGDPQLTNVKNFLNTTGCTEKKATRKLDKNYWGDNSQVIDAKLLGKEVSAGAQLAWSGSTGPGGCGCANGLPGAPNTHLHIFTAHKDPTNSTWYFIDPYGEYDPPACYPVKATDPITNLDCSWFPVTFKGGQPQYPQ